MALLHEALKYATVGWNVFPVGKNKQPLTPQGFKNATTEEKIITAWWKNFPSASIGIATGRISKLVVLDVDLNKEGAEKSFHQIIERHGELTTAVVAETGGGGLHFYFKHPGAGTTVSNAQEFLGLKGIDVRGDGGYVVAPPSLHLSGNLYSWRPGGSPFENAPGECPEFLKAPDLKQTKFQFSGSLTEGTRNRALTSIAGLLRSLALSEEEIYIILEIQNSSRCSPPLEDKDLRTIARSIVKYPPANTKEKVFLDKGALGDLLYFEQTDTGFSKMIEFCFRGKIKFDHTQGKWFLWKNHFWARDEISEVLLKAIETALLYKEAAKQIEDDAIKRRALAFAKKIQSKSRLDAGLSLTEICPSVATLQRRWNSDPDLIALQNGVVNLKTGEFRGGIPEDNINSHLTTEYSKDAVCPFWEQFLLDVFEEDLQIIQFVQRAIGYSITGHIKEQCLFLLVGAGANGKSTLLDVLHTLFGVYAFAAPFSTFERFSFPTQQTNDLAALSNVRFVMASEPNEGARLNEARIKSLTGGEKISARFLHKEFFEFLPTFKIWLGANHLPRVFDDSVGFWRRVKKIDFNVQFKDGGEKEKNPRIKKRDPDLTNKLKQELPGILNWIIEGALAWYQGGLQVPPLIKTATETYRMDSDPLAEFLTFCCTQEEYLEVSASILYKTYIRYCKDRLLKSFEILSSTKFHQRILREFGRAEGKTEKIYKGLGLNQDALDKLAQGGVTVIRSSEKIHG